MKTSFKFQHVWCDQEEEEKKIWNRIRWTNKRQRTHQCVFIFDSLWMCKLRSEKKNEKKNLAAALHSKHTQGERANIILLSTSDCVKTRRRRNKLRKIFFRRKFVRWCRGIGFAAAVSNARRGRRKVTFWNRDSRYKSYIDFLMRALLAKFPRDILHIKSPWLMHIHTHILRTTNHIVYRFSAKDGFLASYIENYIYWRRQTIFSNDTSMSVYSSAEKEKFVIFFFH